MQQHHNLMANSFIEGAFGKLSYSLDGLHAASARND